MLRHREAVARVRDLEAAVAAEEQRFGPDDPRTVDSRLRLVKAYEDSETGGDGLEVDSRVAAELIKVVDSRVRTLGPDHPDTLDVRYELVFPRYRRLFQDPQLGAAAHDELVMELRSIADDSARVLGPAHAKTLETWWMLSRHCPQSERPELVERVVQGWERVLAEREQQFGPDDPQTLEVMLTLASLYRVDRPDVAQQLAERMTAGWERVAASRSRRLGPVHPDTVAAREQHLLLVDGWVSQSSAVVLYEELVAEHVRRLGPDHPRTLHWQRMLLGWKRLSGNATPETAAFAESLLDRFRDVLGPDHDDYLMLRHYVMSDYLVAGDVAAAFDIKRRYPSPDDEEDAEPGDHDHPMP